MTDKTHVEISKTSLWKLAGGLLTAFVCLCLWIYQTNWDDQKEKDRIQTKAIQTSQQAIQLTVDETKENTKCIAVEKKRMDGHEVNPVAHDK